MRIGRLGADGRHKSRGVELIDFKPVEKRFSYFRILDHTPRADKAGDIECLRRGPESYRHGGSVFAAVGKREVTAAAKHQIAVNLVGDHKHAIFAAEAPHLGQSLAAPLQTDRVVGIAHYHHLRVLFGKNPLKLLKIHLIVTPVPAKRIGDQLTLVTFNHNFERMIDRRLNHNLVPLLGEEIHGESDTFHHPGHISEFVALYLEAVTAVEPVDNRTPVSVGRA